MILAVALMLAAIGLSYVVSFGLVAFAFACVGWMLP